MLDPRTLARALGGEASRNTVQAPGPGHSRQDRSLSIRLDAGAPDGFVVHSFAGDDPIECRDHVRAAAGLPGFEPERNAPPSRRSAPVRDTMSVGDRAAGAIAIWQQAISPAGTMAEHYLRSRGLELEGEDIRFHGSLRYEGRTVPGMVALRRAAAMDAEARRRRLIMAELGAWA